MCVYLLEVLECLLLFETGWSSCWLLNVPNSELEKSGIWIRKANENRLSDKWSGKESGLSGTLCAQCIQCGCKYSVYYTEASRYGWMSTVQLEAGRYQIDVRTLCSSCHPSTVLCPSVAPIFIAAVSSSNRSNSSSTMARSHIFLLCNYPFQARGFFTVSKRIARVHWHSKVLFVKLSFYLLFPSRPFHRTVILIALQKCILTVALPTTVASKKLFFMHFSLSGPLFPGSLCSALFTDSLRLLQASFGSTGCTVPSHRFTVTCRFPILLSRKYASLW